MNPFAIPITHCDLSKTSDLVSPKEMDTAIRRSHSESRARLRIAAAINKARDHREKIHQQAQGQEAHRDHPQGCRGSKLPL